jgi:HK97 family phage prohead protease
MEHLTLKAVTTQVTDQGVFEAVISTASVDREKDIVEPAAMVAALKKWNRPIPLAWNHSTKAEDIIGSVEPMTVREVDREVVVGGQVDLESKQGGEAWRSFKSGTVGFSYGDLDLKSSDRKGGGKHIVELDVFEITATPTPMNNDTRVLAVKGLEDKVTALEKRLQKLEGSIGTLENVGPGRHTPDVPPEATRQAVAHGRDGTPERTSPQEPGPSTQELVDRSRELMLQALRR